MASGLRSSHAVRSWARGALVGAAALLPVWAAAALQPGCGSVTAEPDGGDDAGSGGDAATGPHVTVLTPDAEPLPGQSLCEVTITTDIPLEKAVHVDVCTDLDYPTNPPAGGPHWGVWAAFTTYEVPVPREMYVHDMEHGGVVLLHRCDGPCPEVLELLADARDAVAGDPICLQVPGGPTERVLVTPDPELDVPIAAAAWGATYKATCLDPDSLRAFVKEHYGHGTETTCAQGKLYGDPGSGAPDCTGGAGGAGGAGGGAGGTDGTGSTTGGAGGASGSAGADAG